MFNHINWFYDVYSHNFVPTIVLNKLEDSPQICKYVLNNYCFKKVTIKFDFYTLNYFNLNNIHLRIIKV